MRIAFCLLGFLLSLASLACKPWAGNSCATVMVAKGERLLLGHNLDESMEIPGWLLVNKRGIEKESLSYSELRSGGSKGSSRIQWTSKYGSLTGNCFGLEFPDGGLNEAGLYVWEQNLPGSEYPEDPKRIQMYHHLWIQYLLDNFATVPEVLESLNQVVPGGHCTWHFFVADRSGKSAVIYFEEKKTRIFTGEQLPVKVLTNSTYPSNLKRLHDYQGFGGSQPIDLRSDCGRKDPRFLWAAFMLQEIEQGKRAADVDQTFEILKQLWRDSNRWATVVDMRQQRIYWNTNRSRRIKSVDLNSVNFDPKTPAQGIDLHQAGPAQWVPYTEKTNQELLEAMFKGIDAGWLGNLFWKRSMKAGLLRYSLCRKP